MVAFPLWASRLRVLCTSVTAAAVANAAGAAQQLLTVYVMILSAQAQQPQQPSVQSSQSSNAEVRQHSRDTAGQLGMLCGNCNQIAHAGFWSTAAGATDAA
jgi:hypothetical protein